MVLLYFKIIVLFSLVILQNAQSKDLPNRVKHLLRYVNDFRSFVRAFNLDDSSLEIGFQSNERNFGDKVAVLENEPCKPRPQVVEIPQPSDMNKFYYPYHVSLHRCSGSCGANPFGTKCVSSVNVSVQVRVANITWEGSKEKENIYPRITHVQFHNETQCKCQCKHDSSACNRFQYWDEAHCKCRCKGFCSRNFVSHPSECCKCMEKKSCTRKQQWNWETCSCECKRTKPCKVTRKIRDPSTCKCRCPFIICRYGAELDERSCRCQVRVKK